MINLISNEIKNKIKKIFYIRFLVTFFVVIGLSIFVVVLILTPLFLFSLSQKKLLINQLYTQNKTPGGTYNYGVEKIIKDLDYKLGIVDVSLENKFLLSNKIKKILSKKIEGIKITDINYTEDLMRGKVFKLKGYASSRETLLSFKNILQKDPDFKDIDLPISSFIQKTNIQFNLTLTSS